jgi:Family of unknown function (DUF6134)
VIGHHLAWNRHAPEDGPMKPVLRILAACLSLAGALLLSGVADAAAAPQKLVYSIHHSRYGTIGTYTNTVMRNGDDTTVTTEIRIAVSFFGVTLFRQEASRQERWNGERLVSFHGVTTTNGNAIELKGSAEGDHFVMNTPHGETVAPANVRLANPWSPGILGSNMLVTPDRGRLDEVRVSGGDAMTLSLAGHQVLAKKYEVYLLDGRKKYEIDLDEHGTPVQFVLFNQDGSVTFSLNG